MSRTRSPTQTLTASAAKQSNAKKYVKIRAMTSLPPGCLATAKRSAAQKHEKGVTTNTINAIPNRLASE